MQAQVLPHKFQYSPNSAATSCLSCTGNVTEDNTACTPPADNKNCPQGTRFYIVYLDHMTTLYLILFCAGSNSLILKL